MEKNKRKSVDGIITRRDPRAARTVGDVQIPVRGAAPRAAGEMPARAKKPVTKEIKAPDADINDFLAEIGYEQDVTDEVVRKDNKREAKQGKKDARAEEKQARKETKKGKKKGRGKKIALIVIACVVGLGAIGVGIGWNYIRDKICQMSVESCDFDFGDLWGIATGGSEESLTPLAMDENGRTNVLFFGTSGSSMDNSSHDGAQLADSIMVLSFDQKKKDVKMVSLPRDLKAKQTCTATGKLNEGYWCVYSKNKDEKAAATSFMKEIEGITGLKLQYFVHMNWGALIKIVDSVGGIDIAIEYQGDKEKYTGDLPVIWTTDKRGIQDRNYDWACKNKCYFVKYENGTVQHLDGRHALALARARGESGPAYGTNGNWSREMNQQAIIEAIVAKVKKTNFVTDLNAAIGVLDAVGDNVRMNFKSEEYRTLFKLAGSLNLSDMVSINIQPLFTTGMLPVPGVNSRECGGPRPGCLSYVLPRLGTYNYSDIQKLIKQKLSSDPAISEGATIDVLNGGGPNGAAKTQSNRLIEKGYTVGKVGDATKKDFVGMTLVVLNKEMAGTRKALEKLFPDVKVVEGKIDGVNSTADFVLVVGAEPEE